MYAAFCLFGIHAAIAAPAVSLPGQLPPSSRQYPRTTLRRQAEDLLALDPGAGAAICVYHADACRYDLSIDLPKRRSWRDLR